MTSRPAAPRDVDARLTRGEDLVAPARLLRVGDDERSACAASLSEAYVAGRLSPAEHDSRLSRALVAVTAADLDGLVDDLPTPSSPGAALRQRSWEPALVSLAWVALFQFVLMVVAFYLAADLERETRSALSIFLAVWGTGTLSAATGALVSRRHPASRAADRRRA